MNKINSYSKRIIFILFLIMILSIYSNSLLADIDEDDGVYFIDIFDDLNDFELINCTTSIENGKIILDPYSSTTRTYDYSDWTIQSEDKAYSYATPYFFLLLPPKITIPLFENEFDEDLDYKAIRSKNDIFYPLEEFDESSPLKVIHHYRFKINEDINFTENINIYWCGKAVNDQKITLYYWQPIGSIGKWEEAAIGNSNSSVITIQQNFTGDLFISEDNFIDICIAVTPKFGERCSLYTDYVKISTHGQGLSAYGSAITNIISPQNINRWELLSWEDFHRSGTSIRYHLYYENKTGFDNLIEETYLQGNQNGFTTPPIDLDEIPRQYKIKIQANLSTNNSSFSPEIDSLILTWQTNTNRWKDEFSTSIRVDEVKNISISDDKARLLVSLNDWVMFGQNSENKRFSNGFGPEINNHSMYWQSTTQSGGEYRNPIIKDNKLYISSIDGDKIFCFNSTIPDVDPINPYYEIDIPEYTLKNSPAVSNDGILILATGTSSIGGDRDNKVFAYDINNISLDIPIIPIWTFEYNNDNNSYICYSSSPTIYEEKIFLSSWSGKSSIWDSIGDYFNISSGNNKLLALDFDGNLEWEYDLPAGSFSSPAVKDNIVIVGCENKNGDSIFALNTNNGSKIWGKNIGPIGRSSPIIHDDMVIVISKESTLASFTGYEKVFAMNIDGSIKWNISIGDNIPDNYKQIGSSSPSVINDVIYLASADGTIYAINTENGNEIWNKKIYTKSLTSTNYLISSPASAESIIYIGTPDGVLYAINSSDKTTIWQEDSYENSPILSSPIVVNGLVYYNSENGMLYSRGELRVLENTRIKGSITSIPIKLPDTNYIWNKFHSTSSTSDGKIEYYILDKWKSVLLDDVLDGSNISKSIVNNHDTIRLRADFFANYSSNISGEAILCYIQTRGGFQF